MSLGSSISKAADKIHCAVAMTGNSIQNGNMVSQSFVGLNGIAAGLTSIGPQLRSLT